MDMVNDGKDIRLDTPQAVKEALASGKDLYNPETGEFWWEYNYTGSIANTYVHLDDPNLLAVIDNPDFDLYEDIVGGLNMGPMPPERRTAWTRPQKSPHGRRSTSPSTATAMTRS